MERFNTWLSNALSCIDPTAIFYQERLVAFDQLNSSDFIQAQKEAYTYVPLKALQGRYAAHTYGYNKTFEACSAEKISLNLDREITLTFVDGIYVHELSDLGCDHQAVVLCDAEDMHPLEQDSFAQVYRKILETNKDFATALHLLLMQHAYLIKIKEHVLQPVHIHICHIVTPKACHVMPFFFIQVGQSSHIVVTESWTGIERVHRIPQDLPCVNSLVYIDLACQASLAWYALPSRGDPLYHIHTLYGNQYKDSLFKHHHFHFGQCYGRNRIIIHLLDSHASAHCYGLSALSQDSGLDHAVQVLHQAEHGTSQQHYKSILNDQAVFSLHGSVFLVPDAQKTDAYQFSESIVLGDHAAYYNRPQLEIYADDVKCSHGSTVGQLEEETLFYMRTRGLSLSSARLLLLEAFGAGVIKQVPWQALQEYLANGFRVLLDRGDF